MANPLTRLRFGARMLQRRLQRVPRLCPYCGHEQPELLGRKKLVFDILRCPACLLIFRYPPDSPADNEAYYQSAYRQSFDVPTPGEMARLRQAGFRGTPYDFTDRVALVKSVAPGPHLLDYGCSWGYGLAQFTAAGFDAIGFEISEARAARGREGLGVRIVSSTEELRRTSAQPFDVVFSSHVLEHLPDLAHSFDFFSRVLRRGGVMVHLLPNFAGASARAGAFWHWIGRDHPVAPTRAFFERALPAHGFEPAAPVDDEGDELIVIATKR